MLLNPQLFILPQSEIRETGIQNLTYGSLSEKGLLTMTNSINKYHTCTESIYGFDLGCGDGELIYHLQKALPDSIWEGVEISNHRVSVQTRDVTIWQGDMLEENFRPYNILHADNLCLETDIAERLERKIAQEFSGLYLTYRTPENLDFIRTAIKLDTVFTETTWSIHPIHIYRVI
jgi:tRNA G46 methylase TrmB